MAEKDALYSWQTPRDRTLRASDNDRSGVGEILRKAHVEGRLDSDEFADRYGRCLEAKTYVELDGLLSDLPVRNSGSPSTSSSPATWPGASPWADRWASVSYNPQYGGAWGSSPYGAPQTPANSSARQPSRRVWAFLPLLWLTVIIAGFALSSGHFLWLAFPVFFFFWFGHRRSRPAKGRRRYDNWM